MKKRLITVAVVATVLALGGISGAHDWNPPRNHFGANLSGFNETPQSISTTGHGHLELRIDTQMEEITFELTYDDLEGVAPAFAMGVVTQAHIHFGSFWTSGGVSAFLCGGSGKPPCPLPPATVTGTITPADVIGPAGGGIEPMSFDELVRAIRAGFAYGNVHTSSWPGGEIRGQLRPGVRRHGDDDDN